MHQFISSLPLKKARSVADRGSGLKRRDLCFTPAPYVTPHHHLSRCHPPLPINVGPWLVAPTLPPPRQCMAMAAVKYLGLFVAKSLVRSFFLPFFIWCQKNVSLRCFLFSLQFDASSVRLTRAALNCAAPHTPPSHPKHNTMRHGAALEFSAANILVAV